MAREKQMRQEVDYIGDAVWADVERQLGEVAIVALDMDSLPVTVEQGDVTASFERESIAIEGEVGQDMELVAVVPLDGIASDTDVGLVTYLSRALASIDEDQLVVSLNDAVTVDEVQQAVTVDGEVGVTDSTDSRIDPWAESNISTIEDATTNAGDADAASLELGAYRHKVDILVNGTNDDWTVTVEVQDANGDWIQFAAFEAETGGQDDVLQIETVATDVRAHFDQSVDRLTMYSKGAQ